MVQASQNITFSSATLQSIRHWRAAVPEPELLEDEVLEEDGLPPWFDAAAPWMASIVFHLGVGLLVLFLAWFVIGAANRLARDVEPIVIPSTFQDPGTPGGLPAPGELNSSREAAQNRIKNLMQSDGWAQYESNTPAASSMLNEAGGAEAADVIFRGVGGSTGIGQGNGMGSGGPLAPYGTPGGGWGAGPKSNFFGNGGGAFRIVYVIDHSGSLVDNFDFLREEVKRSVGNLLPVQQFAVVAFSEDVRVLGPLGLQRATASAKRNLDRRIDEIDARGQNDDLLLPFERAFETAFSMKPQLIYFLTDGAFDPKLFDLVNGLNRSHKIRINTLAFVNADPRYARQLRKLAQDNGGTYKFISEKDLGG